MQQNDFASEYKEMIRADVPDLWSRIEAKIDALQENADNELKATGVSVSENSPENEAVDAGEQTVAA